MRIAWVVPGFQGREDEPGIPALTSVAHALAAEHDLQIFTVRFPPRDEQYQLGRVMVHGFGRTGGGSAARRRLNSLWRWARVLWAIAAAHREAPFDVIHGYWATESGMLAALAGRLLGAPSLVSVAGGELARVRPIGYGARLRRTERAQVWLTLHLATSIGVGSEDARSRLLAWTPWLRRRVRALPLGYDPAIFHPAEVDPGSDMSRSTARRPWPTYSEPTTKPADANRPSSGRNRRRSYHPDPHWGWTGGLVEEAPTILAVASWSPVKGHDLLLDAMKVLVERGVRCRLLLAGERTDGQEARQAIAARRLEGQVEALGALNQTALAALLIEARVAAITSWHEAQCLAVVEALACGVRVVATPVGIAREFLRDPRLGVCIARRSPALLADALRARLDPPTVHADDEQARRLRAAAVAHLALPRVAERLLTTYAELANPAPLAKA